jgi:hypothetical protein
LTVRDGSRFIVKSHAVGDWYERELIGSHEAWYRGAGPRIEWEHRWRKPPFVIVYEHIEGTPLSPVDDDIDWIATAVAVNKLHDAKLRQALPRFERSDGTWVHYMQELLMTYYDALADGGAISRETTGGLYEEVHRRLRELGEPPRTFLHGDLRPEHVLVRPKTGTPGSPPFAERVKLVDYSAAGCGDAAWDLVTLTQWDPLRLPVVLSTYCRPSLRLEEHLVRVEMPYRFIQHLGEAYWIARAGGDPEPELARLLQLV